MKIKIVYQCITNFMSENEWKNNILSYLKIIENTRTGSLLLKKINYYIQIGYDIYIKNYSETKVFQYPHFYQNKKKFIVVIPDTPYFVKVPVLNNLLIENVFINDDLNHDLNLASKCLPLNFKLDDDIVNSFSIFEFQPTVVILFHELIHCIRFIENISDNKLEEEATIYGIKNITLKIEQKFITENSFRKELNLGYRLSHDSQFYFVHGVHNNISLSKEVLKSMFKKLMI